MKKIVIDTNCLARVFDVSNKEHPEYVPIHDGIFKHGNLTITYGGEKYNKELEKASRYRRILLELNKARKAIQMEDDNVNKLETKLIKLTKRTKFNDQHIIAIVIEGRCDVICSKDNNSHSFFQDKKLYPKRFKRPGIYSGLGSSSILN